MKFFHVIGSFASPLLKKSQLCRNPVSVCILLSLKRYYVMSYSFEPGFKNLSSGFEYIEENFKETTRTVESSRKALRYRSSTFSGDNTLNVSEIDSLSFASFSVSSSSRNLFTSLCEKGLTSPLIDHFAHCESENLSYTSPYPDRFCGVLFKHDPLSTNPELLSRFFSVPSEDFTSPPLFCYQYRINGGMSTFSRIKRLDPSFFECLSRAIDLRLCIIRRLDLCMDCSEDFMPFVSKDVRLGRTSTFKTNIRGFGTLDGSTFSNELLGRQSKMSSAIKKSSSFHLDSLYFGNPRRTNCVVLFYDKKKEQLERKSLSHFGETRIEIRLYSTSRSCKYTPLMNTLFRCSLSSGESDNSQLLRHLIFTSLLFSHACFTVSQKFSVSSLFSDINNPKWSPWFQDLFFACLNDFFERENILVVSKATFFNRLSSYKQTPSSILDIFSVEFLFSVTGRGVPCRAPEKEESSFVSNDTLPCNDFPLLLESDLPIEAKPKKKGWCFP